MIYHIAWDPIQQMKGEESSVAKFSMAMIGIHAMAKELKQILIFLQFIQLLSDDCRC